MNYDFINYTFVDFRGVHVSGYTGAYVDRVYK